MKKPMKKTQLYHLKFKGDGVGSIPNKEVNKIKTVGSKLVNFLGNQVYGKLEIISDKGNEIRIDFKNL